MQFVGRLEDALLHAAGPCKTPEEMVADSLVNCVASNELQKFYPPMRLGEIRENLLQSISLDAFAQIYDLPPLIAGDVFQLALFDTVLLVDDCSSMNEGTKWNDVKCIVEHVVNMVSQINSSGLQVEFVHRGVRALGVTSSEDLDVLFELMEPNGCTPFIQPLTVKVLEPFYARCRGHRLSLSEPMNALEINRLRLETEAHAATPTYLPADHVAAVAGQVFPATPTAAAVHCGSPTSSGSVGSGKGSFFQQLQEKRKSRDLQLEMGAGFSPFSPTSPAALSSAEVTPSADHGQSSDENGTSKSPISSSSPHFVKPIVVHLITDHVPTAERAQQLFAKVDATLRRLGMPRSSINIGIVHVGAVSEPVPSSSQPQLPLPQNPFVGCRMSYISDYEIELAVLDEQAAKLFNPDMYIARLLLGSIDQRYASPHESERPQAQDTFVAAVIDLQHSDDDQEAVDPNDKTVSARQRRPEGSKVKTKMPVPHRNDGRDASDLLSKMCVQSSKPKLLRRNTGPKWSIMKIVEVIDDLVQLAT
jgi:hypothetical protein